MFFALICTVFALKMALNLVCLLDVLLEMFFVAWTVVIFVFFRLFSIDFALEWALILLSIWVLMLWML